MRRAIFTALAAGALIFGSAGAALAAGNGATPGHFSYNDGVFGAVTCNETHHPGDLPAVVTQNVPGATTKGGWDEIECKIANNPRPDLAGTSFLNGWTSDFVGFGVPVPPDSDTHGGLVWDKINPPGTQENAFAWYPSN